MDLIAQLAGQLGLPPEQAQALAGAALGGVQESVARDAGPEVAAQLDEAVPEMQQWKARAQSEAESGGEGLGGLLGSAVGALGGGDSLALLTQLATQFGVAPQVVSVVGPLVKQFLEGRLEANLLAQVMSALPAFTGGASQGGGLGSLFS